ncbi:carboxylesterase/lipase family protein [Streptomyces sp. NPDC088387]|uniref:carboxylesterase/lipase family protein n=1 Tax=Streptomyces sp. NPDC088387 TaxID=3365859 RepID=UPI0037F15055
MDTVRTAQGLIRGSEDGGVLSCLGLPFAAPPVGELRWAPPAEPASWSGVRDATRFGNAAIQPAGGIPLGAGQSEDCLYLNVFTTTPDPAARRPVMVWIHGGGFVRGAASEPGTPGGPLARHGVVLVTVNYRLGPLGFLAHPHVSPNLAVQDWVAALTWVRRNIADFGGDPGNVTVFGQSAGAAACRALLQTPSAHGLFHRAIFMSAGFEDFAAVETPDRARAAGVTERFVADLGHRDIGDLRKLPIEDVAAAASRWQGTFPPPGELHTPANLVWCPAPDSETVTDDFTGRPADVEVMFGVTRDEARFFHGPDGVLPPRRERPADIYTPRTLAAMARRLGGTRAADIVAHFQERRLSPYEALAELTTAAVWHEPALATYHRFAAPDRTAYFYEFARHSPGSVTSGLLAQHTADIAYVFGTVAAGDFYDGTDAEVADAMRHAWTTFARTGVPTDPDGTPWPACETTEPRFTVIEDRPRARPLSTFDTPLCRLIAARRAN